MHTRQKQCEWNEALLNNANPTSEDYCVMSCTNRVREWPLECA